MLLLAKVRSNGTADLLIVLSDENIERVRHYDPVEVLWRELPKEYAMRRPHTIAVTYCTPAEEAQLLQQSVSDPDWRAKAFAALTRGFEVKPGDHDFGPTVLGKPPEGTKQ